MAVPADHNIKFKEIAKLNKYTNLRTDVARMKDVQATMVAFIIGALGINITETKDLC